MNAIAAIPAARLDIDAIQIHGAHGYLLHQFLPRFRASARTNTAD